MKKLSFIIAAAQFAFVFFSDLAVAKTIKSAPVKIVVAGATVTESGMPAWRQGQAVGEWRQIPNSALSNVPISVNTYPTLGNTGPSSKVGAWCGFGIDTRDSSIYSAANGGHNDYAGNEVDRIRLSDDAPAWKEVKASTPAEQVVARQDHYADGRPTSRHSYYGAFVNEVRDRVMIIGGSGWGAPLTHSIDAFSLALNDWDSANSFPNISADALEATAFTEDKRNGDIYNFDNYKVMRWKSSSNTWQDLNTAGTPAYGQYSASALDTKRNRILVVGGNAGEHSTYDISGNTMQQIVFSGPNSGVVGGDTGDGLVYDSNLDTYLFRKGGGGSTVYRINAQSFSIDTLSTTLGNTVPAADNGVWRRFLFVPKLKGVIFAPTYNGNMWFLRTAD